MADRYERTVEIGCTGTENPAGPPQYDKPLEFEGATKLKRAAIIDDNDARTVSITIQSGSVRNKRDGRSGPRAKGRLVKVVC